MISKDVKILLKYIIKNSEKFPDSNQRCYNWRIEEFERENMKKLEDMDDSFLSFNYDRSIRQKIKIDIFDRKCTCKEIMIILKNISKLCEIKITANYEFIVDKKDINILKFLTKLL